MIGMDSFKIDTIFHDDGEQKAIKPIYKGNPFGPWIEIDKRRDHMTSCVYGIEDIHICCQFHNHMLKMFNYNYDDEYSMAIGLFGERGWRLSGYSHTISRKETEYNYDFQSTGKLLSVVSATPDTTVILLDRGDNLLHFLMEAQEMWNESSLPQHIESTDPPLFYDEYCRIDTTYHLSGGIKTLSQMAGKKRNGVFIEFNRQGRVINVSTYLAGKPEGPQFIFDRNGTPIIAGYKSGKKWIGTVVTFHKNGIPKHVYMRTDSTTIMVGNYDEDGEYVGEEMFHQYGNNFCDNLGRLSKKADEFNKKHFKSDVIQLFQEHDLF